MALKYKFVAQLQV